MSKFLDKVQPKNKTQLKSLIEYAFNHNIYDLNFIDASEITDMSWLFEYISCNFDISNWDVSNVKDMRYMFYGCHNFNCDLSNWDVSKVEDMRYMFYSCKNFNCDLSNWNVLNVTDMHSMFAMCENFKGKGIENWDVSKVKDMNYMFNNCNKTSIPNWYKLYHRK